MHPYATATRDLQSLLFTLWLEEPLFWLIPFEEQGWARLTTSCSHGRGLATPQISDFCTRGGDFALLAASLCRDFALFDPI